MEAPENAALNALRSVFRLTFFRPGQLEAVLATLAGQDSLIILPTGGGKSVCFQLPCHLRSCGFTVVVCPLIALAKDQVERCDERGIYAERWNCEVSESRKASIAKDMVSDEPSLRLLYITPEGLRHPKLLESLKEACVKKNLVSFAVDEAHTVSEWGHDFRPAYLELSCLKQEFPSVPVAALTASCTSKVSDDIISLLQLRSPRIIKGSFNRPNIAYQVRFKELLGEGSDTAALEDLIHFIRQRSDQCGIIYARLRATCDWLASALAARDIDIGCYHAGKSTESRARVQCDWSSGGVNVVVATIAFGMGIDRADVRWVVHWNVPSSMEGFYQESGRAGRDGQPSLSIMYASHADLQAAHKMERGTRTGAVAEVASYVHGRSCRRKCILNFFGEQSGPCRSECDEICDYCADPCAVQRALSQLEKQEIARGSKAAAVRGRMMGIRLESDTDGADAEGHCAGSTQFLRAARAAWTRATIYDGTPKDLGDNDLTLHSQGSGCILQEKLGSYTSSQCGHENPDGHTGALQVLRRPPVLKRPLKAAASAAAVPVAAAGALCPDVAAYRQLPPSHGCLQPEKRGAGVGEEVDLGLVRPSHTQGSEPSHSAAGRSCTDSQSHATGAEVNEIQPRQREVKKLKACAHLPFKAPARAARPLLARLPEGAQAEQGICWERNTDAVGAGRLSGVEDAAHCQLEATPSQRLQVAATSVNGFPLAQPMGTDGTESGKDAMCPRARLLVKRRLPFKPPVRIKPV
ncbi:hypothetical protein Vafri_9495 [Volvox africanus]|uniref:ATP-dependent DNA helicase n=1 Tax=Volvox africanus TaxID=51714 RepID=A0A8J4B4H9_9CHLO|nr:hypothetical protein Vafri_9495 [Volvox africanus]